MNAARQLGYYTIDDIYNLPDGERAELIDGQIYMMATPGYATSTNCNGIIIQDKGLYRKKKRGL